MQPGFLNAAPPELVWVSSASGDLEGHIGTVAKRSGEHVKVELLADSIRRTLPASQCHTLRKRRPGARMLTMSVKPGEVYLTALLNTWCFPDRATGRPLNLQPELVDLILSFLVVPPVETSCCRAVSCSSRDDHGDRCSIANSLDPCCENWWISANRCPGGAGAEWVAYALGAEGVEAGGAACRVERVDLRIPSLPSGPLSVRDWHLESAPSADGPWARASRDLRTLDSEGLQAFKIEPPVEARFVRIVCKRNAARAAADASRASMVRRGLLDDSLESEQDLLLSMSRLPSCIGFFSIAFS